MADFVLEAVKLMTDYITKRSVAIVVRDSRGNVACGTSTCVRVGEHALLATAGHVIEDLEDQRIQLVPDSELSSKPLSFIGRSCSPSKRRRSETDVAWIELASEVAQDHRLKFLALSDLKLNQLSNDRDHPFLINGYPRQRAHLSSTSIDLESNVAFSMMASDEKLGRPRREYEVITEYPPHDEDDQPISTAPSAPGFSGGGVWWHPRHDEISIISPSHMKLIAINTRWRSDVSILFSTRIYEWLRLVGEDFPDSEPLLRTMGL